MLMFFIVFNYATQVAMEIATEKTSRVIEMIITSVSPITHIMAKIAGIIAVALTQIVMIVVVAIICIFAFDLKRMLKDFHVSMSHIMASFNRRIVMYDYRNINIRVASGNIRFFSNKN